MEFLILFLWFAGGILLTAIIYAVKNKVDVFKDLKDRVDTYEELLQELSYLKQILEHYGLEVGFKDVEGSENEKQPFIKVHDGEFKKQLEEKVNEDIKKQIENQNKEGGSE